MASFDRKAFLSLPTGSSYLECPLANNYYSLYTGPSTEIFCGQTPKGFVFAAKVPQEITHEKTLAHTEDDPAELLKVTDARLALGRRVVRCDQSAAAAAPQAREALRRGILVLLFPPLGLFMGIFSFLFRRHNLSRVS